VVNKKVLIIPTVSKMEIVEFGEKGEGKDE